MEEHWYLMRVVGAKKDALIRQQLDAAGMRWFQPLERTVQTKNGTNHTVLKAYVGGLFFCYGTEDAIDVQIKRSDNVLQWVFQRGKTISDHIIIPTLEMENFINVAEATLGTSRYISIEEALHYHGKHVRLQGGILHNVEATLVGRGKTKTLVVILGKLIAIEAKTAVEGFIILD